MRGRGLAAIHGVCGQADDKADAVLLDSYLSHIPGIGEESKFMQPLLWYIVVACLWFLFGGVLDRYNRLILGLQLPEVWSGVLFFLFLSLAGLFLRIPFSLYTTFYVKILLAGFVGSIGLYPLQPVSRFFSRRQEVEADDYAAELTGNPHSLARSLVALGRDNLANLHPHPLYAAFHYSHPPLAQRVARLLRMS